MFKKILVPINPSGTKEDKLIEIVIAEGIKNNAEVHLVYFGNAEDYVSRLEYYAGKCRDKKVKTICRSLKFDEEYKDIPEAINNLSENFDLIIMGHRKFDKIYRFVHQSAAADTINLVSVPVMIIPENEEEHFAYKTRKPIT